jgi:hypothetical protein
MKKYWEKVSYKKLFQIILKAEKEKSRQASKDVRKKMYKTNDDKPSFDEISNLIKEAPKTFDSIKENWRKENFVKAISVIYFLRDLTEEPDHFFPWFFTLLENESGIIRQATVRMINIELGPLTVHIRCPESKHWSRKFSVETADLILRGLFICLYKLLHKYWKKSYENHKYINTLPPSPYKSVQIILRDMEYLCGEKYLKQVEEKIYNE